MGTQGRHSRRTKKQITIDTHPDHFCPICIEEFNDIELRFFPCPCKYKVCSMCVHIINEGDKKCPNCRELYDESKHKIFDTVAQAKNFVSEKSNQKPKLKPKKYDRRRYRYYGKDYPISGTDMYYYNKYGYSYNWYGYGNEQKHYGEQWNDYYWY